MREYKLRGKRVDTGEWIYGYLVPRELLEDPDYLSPLWIATGFENVCMAVDKETVGQFTGLRDKNGKEIYEGDIVICTYGKWHEEPKGLTRIGKVVYDIKTCAFKIAVKDSAVLVSLYDTKTKDIEVIGNIHENTELLND